MDIEIQRNPASRAVSFWLIDTQGMPGKELLAKPVEFVFEEIPDLGLDLPPTFILTQRVAERFIKGLNNSLSNQGYVSDNEATLRGTMEAQKFHLEDLRKLLKLVK